MITVHFLSIMGSGPLITNGLVMVIVLGRICPMRISTCTMHPNTRTMVFLYAYYGYVATGTDLGYYGYLYAYNDYYYKNLAATYLYYMYGYGQDYSAKAWESVYYEDAYNGYASLFVGLASEGGAY